MAIAATSPSGGAGSNVTLSPSQITILRGSIERFLNQYHQPFSALQAFGLVRVLCRGFVFIWKLLHELHSPHVKMDLLRSLTKLPGMVTKAMGVSAFLSP